MGSISNVALVSPDDRGYLRWCAIHRLYRDRPDGDRVPDPQGRWGAMAERVVRHRLGEMVALSPRRILAYTEQRGVFEEPRYRELDAVAVEPDGALTLFEIKCSIDRKFLARGVKQIDRARDTLLQIYSVIRRVMVIVAPPWADPGAVSGFASRLGTHARYAAVERLSGPLSVERVNALWLPAESLPLPAYEPPDVATPLSMHHEAQHHA